MNNRINKLLPILVMASILISGCNANPDSELQTMTSAETTTDTAVTASEITSEEI